MGVPGGPGELLENPGSGGPKGCEGESEATLVPHHGSLKTVREDILVWFFNIVSIQ